jgi:type I restriction enzyme S subunit
MSNLDALKQSLENGRSLETWQQVSLRDIVKLKNGTSFKADDWRTSGFPIIRIQNLKDVEAPFNYFDGDLGKTVVIESGDLLFSWSGSRGTSFGPHIWRGTRGVLNQHIFKVTIRPDARVDNDYLYFVLLYLTAAIEEKSYGLAALVHVRKGDLESTGIPLPALPEQKAIAHVLRTVQQAKEATEKLIVAARQLKQSLMKHLFTYGPVPFDQADKVELKETEIGPVPNHWVEGRFDKFAILQRGFDITKREQRTGQVPVISSSGLTSYHDVARCKGPGVIIGRKGSLGTSHYVESDYWPHDTTLWIKDFKGNYPKFFYHFLTILRLESFDTGTSNPTLNRNYVHAIQVALPERKEQQKMANMIDAVEAYEIKLEQRKNAQDELFRSLLHNLMSGKLRVPIETNEATAEAV